MTTLDLYSLGTPNGHKVHIMLEELGVPYNLHKIDISKDEQFTPEFLAINPNNKIPALVDQDGPGGEPFNIFESGAILIYLAEKFGKFMPTEAKKRYECLQWLMFQMGGVGPMLGQAHHFNVFAPEKVPYGIKRYSDEANRLYKVMNGHLEKNDYFVGGDYTIADMAIFPWTLSYEKQGVNISDYPAVMAWQERLQQREAVKRALDVFNKEKNAA